VTVYFEKKILAETITPILFLKTMVDNLIIFR